MGNDELRKEYFDEERVAEVRAAVAQLMQAEGISNSALAREADIGVSTVSSFLPAKYAGDNAEQALKLSRWLTSRRARERTNNAVRRGPRYVVTPTGNAIAAVLEHAQFAPDLSVIVGVPGVGKTTTVRQYANRNANVFVLTAEPTGASPRALLEDLGEAVGVAALGSSGQRVSKAIVRKLRGSSGLIVVDEAQHLSSLSLDQLRTIHDLAEVGVALVGNPAIFARLEGGTNRGQFAQLYSRVGMRVSRKGATKADVDALLDAWELTDKAARDLCHAVARAGGALRSMTKVLRQAHLRADADGTPVTDEHIMASAHQLGAAPREEAA